MTPPSAGPDQLTQSPRDGQANGLSISLVLWGYAILLVAAFALFRSPLATPEGNETSMSVRRAVFFVANAGTNTGFQTTIAPESLRLPAQIMLLVLMIGCAFLSWVVGGALVCRALRLQCGMRPLFIGSAVLILGAAIFGGVMSPGGQLWPSVFQAVSAVCNGGVWIGAAPPPNGLHTMGVLLPLAVLGGVGITVLIELARLPFHRRLTRHATVSLAGLAAVYVFGVALILVSEWFSGTTGRTDWRSTLVHASTLSVNCRSAGLPIELLSALDRPTQWVTALLMCIGGGSGGAAGGLKVTTLIVMAGGALALIRGRQPAAAFVLSLAWLATYAALIAGTWWCLLGSVPEQSADRLLMLAVSAVGNVGLSHDVLSASGDDAYILSAAMLGGRMIPLGFLWLLGSQREPTEIAVA